ncbi:MAG: tyrosine-type recombinase/integrase, partial [Prevotellaceae bacterium]|nr:tyrosine-type recombinase/integrase [Candidatus Faecinaster equi]
ILEYDAKYLDFISYLCNHPNETDNVKNIISSIFGMKKKEDKPLAIAVLRQLLYKQQMKQSSIEIMMGALDEFDSFLQKYKRKIYLEDINVQLMEDYIEFQKTLKVTHKITGQSVPLEDNTIFAKFKKMLTILGYAANVDMFDTSKIAKLKKRFKTDKTENNQVFLTEEEEEAIMNLRLTGDKDRVRDIFIFQLEIGQRVSDVINLMGKDLSTMIKDGKLRIIQEKTGTLVTPSITPTIKKILEKYNYELPIITKNKINTLIKEVCKEANINTMCECVEMRGGVRYKYSCPKYDLVSSHTSRRSFVGQNISAGIDTSLIRKITGHLSEEAFQHYNRLSSEDAAEAMMKIKGQGGCSNVEVVNDTTNNTPVNPAPNPAQIKGVMLDDIHTMKKILMMLGDNPIEVMDIDDEELLWRRIAIKENELCEKIGCDYKFLKELFNSDITLKDKINIINSKLN